MTVSYINLLKVQRRPVAVLSVNAPSMTTAAQALIDSKAARDRLMRGELPSPAPEPCREDEREAEAAVPTRSRALPLNMLTPPSWRFLLALACVRFGVTAKEVLGPGRTKNVVAARYEAMALIYQHTQQSFPGVGRLMGRDHTTVLHGVNKLGRNFKLVEMLTAHEMARRTKAIPVVRKPRQARQRRKPITRAQRVAFTRNTIRQGYEAGRAPRDIAADVGMTVGTVRVIASSMGLRRPSGTIAGKSIPLGKIDEYRTLCRAKRLTAEEAERIVGALE